MQLLRSRGELSLLQLHPTGPTTIAKMVEKTWVERVGSDRYRITPEGEAALKAELPEDYRRKSLR